MTKHASYDFLRGRQERVEVSDAHGRAKLALEDFEAGESVRILLDDGEAVKNVQRSLKAEGHHLLSLKEAPEGYFILDLKKGED
jgi:TusA-related sulfurtransferase